MVDAKENSSALKKKQQLYVAIAHCRCWSKPLVVLPVKSTTNTSGLCSSSKSVQFLLFHAAKSLRSGMVNLIYVTQPMNVSA